MAELYAQGTDGVVTVDGDWLTIDRTSLSRAGYSKGMRRIPLASITAVELRQARVFTNGFIKFVGPELPGGSQSAMGDENAVTFRRRQARGFNMIRAAVEQSIAERPAGAQGGARESDVTAQLEKLGEQHDQKLITDEEFEAKKAQLLERL